VQNLQERYREFTLPEFGMVKVELKGGLQEKAFLKEFVRMAEEFSKGVVGEVEGFRLDLAKRKEVVKELEKMCKERKEQVVAVVDLIGKKKQEVEDRLKGIQKNSTEIKAKIESIRTKFKDRVLSGVLMPLSRVEEESLIRIEELHLEVNSMKDRVENERKRFIQNRITEEKIMKGFTFESVENKKELKNTVKKLTNIDDQIQKIWGILKRHKVELE